MMKNIRGTSPIIITDNVENLTLTGTANIDGTGNELNNVIVGNGGNNILDGGAWGDAMNDAVFERRRVG